MSAANGQQILQNVSRVTPAWVTINTVLANAYR